jgi:uncharacterized lipoprotein YehR (DUF1307 family)
MENQEEKETSLKYYESKVMRLVIHNRNTDATFIFDAFEEAKKMYAEEIAKAFEKGFEEGVKYTDGLIRSDERFRF